MKYVSGRVKELKVGLSSYSESKTTLITVGNVNVSGSVTATTFFGDGSSLTGIAATDNVRTNSLVVSGVSTFNGAIDANAQIVGAATSNIIPFLYSNYSLFPSATTYHGAVAHAHNTGKLYYAHGGNWIELVSQETTGTVGTGTERYNIGPVDLTTLDVSGISTFAGNINANGNIVGDNSTNISGINSVTATTFYGSGASLTGIDATSLKDAGGNVKIQANPFGAVHTGISTFDVVSVGGTSTFLGNVGVGTAVATDAVKTSNTTKVAAGIVTSYNVFSQIFSGTTGYATGGAQTGMNIAIGNTSTGNTLDTTSCSGNHSNISIGECTGCSLTNTCNVLIGHRTGTNLTSGKRNVLIGAITGTGSPLTGNDNIIFGNGSGGSLTSGGRNIVMGDNTTYSLNTGCCNIILGSMVGDDVSSGSENVIIGNRGGYGAGNGSKNIFLGSCARPSASGASNCLIISNALNDRWIIGDSNYNVGIGILDPTNAIVSNSDTQKLAVGILTAYNIFSTKQINVGENVKLGAAGVVTATTFKGDVDAVNIDVDGRADIDDLIVTGVSTFQSAIDSNAGANIAGGLVANSAQISDLTNTRVVYAGASGELQDSSNLTFNGTTLNGTFSGDGTALSVTIPGISTSGTSEFSNLNLSGIVTAAGAVFGTAKVSDLTDNRVVVAGTAGELEDSTNLTFDGSTLSIIGDATFTGNVTVGGTLTSEDKTNIDSIGIVTARTGVRINSGGLVVTAGVSTFSDAIDANNGANISGGVGLVAATAKVSDLTSGRVVVAGTAGELEDSGSFTFSGGTVTATAFAGDGSALTGITASGLGAIGGLTIKDEGVVVGTAGSVSTIDFRGGLVNVIATAGAAGVATATITSESNPTLAMLNVTGVSTFQSAVGISSDVTISSTDTSNTAGPIVNLYRNSSSPADGDYLGQLKFQGESDTGATRNYAKITGKISDASNGDEDGILEFAFLKAGSQNINARFKSTELMIMNGTDFSVDGDSTFTGDASFNSGLVTINPTGANHAQLTINSLESGSTAGPILKLARDDGAPNDNDFLGIIKFDGSNSTGGQLDYVQVIGKIDDVTNGSEDGTLIIKNVKAGTATTIAEFRSDSLQLLNGTSLTVAGDVSAPNFNSTSDAKLKTNVETITSPLEKLNQIDGVSFNWISDNKPSMGVIADTVEKVLPELVTSNDPKTVNYNGLIGLLIEAVKEQQVQITELKSKLDSLS